MKYSADLVLILFILLSLNACIFEPQQWRQKDLIAFTVEDSNHVTRVVLADYNYPDNYKFITPPEIGAWDPYFSPNKDKVLIKGGSYHDYHYYIYDIENDTLEKIPDFNASDYIDRDPVWNSEGDGIYFNHLIFEPKYYDLNTNEMSTFYMSTNEILVVISPKDTDKLIVWSSQLATRSADSLIYYHLVNVDGEYISEVSNQYFKYYRDDDRIRHHEGYVRWNHNNNKFIYTFSSQISVSDFNGSYKNDYTEGEITYFSPIFGPKNIIFADRYNTETGIRESVKIDMKNQQVDLVSSLFIIAGYDQIHHIDY